MEKIQPGKYFELAYTLYRINADGSRTKVHEVVPEEPDSAIYGLSQGFVPALEEAVLNLGAGDTFEFTATPDRAFGPYDPEEVMAIPRDRFLIDGKFDEEMFQPGSLIPLMTEDGFRLDGLVVELRPTEVVFDFNHPLAKDSVYYKGTILTVRDPKPEELRPANGCGGCGSGGCDNGGCSGGSCNCGGC